MKPPRHLAQALEEKMERILRKEEVLYEDEGTILDFKPEEYKFCSSNEYEKSEILKDILVYEYFNRNSLFSI